MTGLREVGASCQDWSDLMDWAFRAGDKFDYPIKVEVYQHQTRARKNKLDALMAMVRDICRHHYGSMTVPERIVEAQIETLKHMKVNGKDIVSDADAYNHESVFANCECISWERVDPEDLRGGDHHTHCKHYKPHYYARVKLIGGGSYMVPLDDLSSFQDELKETAANDDTKSVFEVTVVNMTKLEYQRLAEFTGH